MLTLCATPIGNLSDISFRTLETLKNSDIILCEDTRVTIKLLNHYEINVKLESYHEHNKNAKTPIIIQKLKDGKNIALVTDAGTPGISDPGEDLIRACINENIKVSSTPGAVALIIALILSGKNTRRFVFEGFLPNDKKEKMNIIESLKDETRTIILYEAPHRLEKTLKLLLEHLGNRNITLAKELTKKFETLLHTTIEDAILKIQSTPPKGEYVIIIEGKSIAQLKSEALKKWDDISLQEHINIYLAQGKSEKEAIKQVAFDLDTPKREIYNQFKVKSNIKNSI
ncbi:16S rRNA (cytidine(1402)-2'-O)-methyltransferase [Candidatus Epulonipiscioides gigas]|nr:16S rRNA (cytidine(1402)-2'-O)-methyltransferase [Epulopiscium sp. SCG-C07WGA-EpuloA2]